MADTFQIGLMNSGRTDLGTVVLDLNSSSSGVQIVRDSFKVEAPERKAQFSNSGRRFGGDYQSAEVHGNGKIGAQFYTQQTTADAAIALWESLIDTAEEYATKDYFVKWQPHGATSPVFYQVRGSGDWEANYKALPFATNKVVVFDVSWPVAPLARGAAVTFSGSSATYPATVELSSVAGTAPALLDLNVAQAASSPGIDFFMVGWTQKPAASTNPVAPFGKIPAYVSSGGSSGASYLTFGAGYAQTASGSGMPDRLRIASPSTGTTYTMGVDINPALMVRDDFTKSEIQLEVWGRIYIGGNQMTSILTTSLEPRYATGATSRFTSEYGSAGKIFRGRTTAAGGAGWHFTKLGTLQATVDTNNAATYTLQLKTEFTDLAGSTAEFAIEYLAVVPARQRALTPTSRENDSTYPKFLNSTAATMKTVRNDLSGWLKPTTGSGQTYYPDSGLGGQLLEIPPGDVSLFVKATQGVPDDPTPTTSDASQSLTISGTIIPRYYLARGT